MKTTSKWRNHLQILKGKYLYPQDKYREKQGKKERQKQKEKINTEKKGEKGERQYQAEIKVARK